MLARIPLRLFLEWMEYSRLSPIGPERLDMNFAILTAKLHNAHFKGQLEPRHFMLSEMIEARKREPQSIESMTTVLKACAANL